MAAGLLKAYQGHQFVFLHLLCQGLENILKSMLLFIDYEKYVQIISKSGCIGHDLDAAVTAVLKEIGDFKISPRTLEEITALNEFYRKHHFRYGSNIDFAIPKTCSNAGYDLHRKAITLIGIMNTLVASEHAGRTIRSRIISRRERISRKACVQ